MGALWELSGSSLGVLWEIFGSSLGALWELVAVVSIQDSNDNVSIQDWGMNEYNIKGSPIRRYFK
jgi:hypothetical protein